MIKISKELIKAITWVESSDNPQAVGTKGERGLMQMSEIAWVDVQQNCPDLRQYSYEKWAHHSTVNTFFGAHYLSLLKKRLGKNRATLHNLLASWNWGLSKVKGVGYDYNRFPESVKRYIQKVKEAMET